MAGDGRHDDHSPAGEKVGTHPTDRGKSGTTRRVLTDSSGGAQWLRRRWGSCA
jgi:hypothetical protein